MTQSDDQAPAAGRTVSELLRLRGPQLTAAERKVVRILISQYPIAGLESLPKLSERAQVSAPTVLRLLAKLGYNAYADFQRALLDEVYARMSEPSTRAGGEGQRDGKDDDLGAVLSRLSENVAETAEHVERSEFDEVVALLSDVKRPVLTLGGFESDVCSLHLLSLLSQLRGDVRHVRANPSGFSVELLDVTRRHVIVAFDFRRYQRGTIDYVRQAAGQHATVVLFTDKWISPAADHARYVFVCDTAGVGPFDSRAGVVALIEALVASVTTAMGTAAQKRIRAVYDRLSGSTWAEGLLRPAPSEQPPGSAAPPRGQGSGRPVEE